MMATAGPPGSSSILPLLASLEDATAGQSEQTDAYLTIANRLSSEESQHFLPVVEKHFCRLGNAILAHITSPNSELSQAALQALGFCVYHSRVASALPETFTADTLSALCSLVQKSTDKNTCTRALWVISKQSFPSDVVAKKVPSILGAVESVWSREDIQSVVMEHEALNVVIRLLDQAPVQMGDGAVRWAKLVIPLVVHSASKVRLRAAAAMEMGLPLLLERQMEVAAIMEPMMSSKLIPELQKLFMSKNETNVLKLWPLFVKLLGKLLHRGGPFINSLLHLEELGFRSSSPTVKKIAFIAWKSLIDNFSLNPEILCSAKRMKLLMQPLTSINIRTEALLLTKVEVWWYLVVQLGPNLSSNFDQVSVPLLQCTIGSDFLVPGTSSRAVAQNGSATPSTPKTGGSSFNSSANVSRMSLNSSIQVQPTFPSIQLLGLEMLLHYFLGPEAVAMAAKRKLVLSLEPLTHSLLSGTSFTKHAAVLISNIRDGFICIGKDAPDSLLDVIWTSLVRFVNLTIESVGSKKERQGCEVLTLMLQALQSVVTSEALPADQVLVLLEATLTGVPQRVLGSTSYQVGKMDVLNGTPALFLVLLLYNSSMIAAFVQDERFFQCLQMLVGCGLSGPTSPLAFGEAVLGAIRGSGCSVQNKEQLLRMWSVMVGPLTETITQSNEVNQGDALEHNFSAVHSALLFPITHLLPGAPLQQTAQKSMLSTWAKLYKVFACCSALVVTAEENICCEELCAKIAASVDKDALKVPATLSCVSSFLQVMVECVDFSPYTPQFQQKLKSPFTPVNWRKKNKVLGNLSTFQSLLVQCLEVYLEDPEACSEATGLALVSVLVALFTNLVLANAIQEVLTSLIQPLRLFYQQAGSEQTAFSAQLLSKLEKLLTDVLGCLQSRSTLAYDDELLSLLSPLLCVLFPHKNKHIRTSVTQFWNTTFANAVCLTYPENIRPILSQVKQKIPIILPGFEVVPVSDELSGQYSSESSQLETKLSGMPVSSVGKRDSLLAKASETKDRSSAKTSKPVSTKLDFSSPKPPRREVLEEEASIDFVFIPPETKERVLTEHQKEVKRTKRVDIPAMYNNLDSSLDTTAFTQYTQSQEDSQDKLPKDQAEKISGDSPGELPQDGVGNTRQTEILTKETQDYATTEEVDKKTEKNLIDEMNSESADVSMEDENKTVDGAKDAIPELADVSMDDDAKKEPRAEAEDMESKDGSSPNISGSSDLVSGTPQKPNSRRQSFITLEKYAEGKSASPSSTSKFTGPLMKLSNTKKTSQTTAGPNPEESQSSMTGKINSQHTVSNDAESPRRPKDSGVKTEPVRLTERLPSDITEDEDVIPDTQTDVEESREKTSPSEELSPSSQEEDLDDSQSSLTQTSPTEPRRSGRCRIRPLLPGEGTEEREEKSVPQKRKRSGEELKNNSQKFSPNQSRPNTRSKQASEEDGGRLQRGTQKDKSETSLTNSQGRAKKRTKLFRSAEDFLDKPEPRRRSTREQDCSQTDLQSDTQSDHDSQSQGRRGRRSKASLESGEDKGQKKEILSPRKQSSQTTTDEIVEQTEKDPQTIAPSSPNDGRSQESELVEKNGQFDDEPKKDSQMVLSQTDSPSQESELEQENENEKGGSTNKSKDGTNKLTESEVKDKRRSRKGANQNLSQEDSQVITPSSSDSQSRRRSGRNKASSEAAESDSKDSSRRQSRSNSQTVTLPENQAEAKIGGRTRRSKAQEELSKSSPESSQSLDGDGLKKSQGRGRYVRRRSSQAFGENSESESQEAIENPPMPKKRGRKPRASLQSPLTVESKTDGTNNKAANDAVSNSQEEDSQSTDAKIDAEESQGSKDQESLQVPADIEQKESPMDVEDGAVEGPEPAAPETEHIQRREEEPGDPETNVDSISQKACDVGDSEPLQSAGRTRVEVEEEAAVDTVVPPDETAEKPQTSETLEDKDEDVPIEENQKDFSEPEQEELPVVPVEEDAAQVGESVANDSEGLSKEDEEPVSDFHTEDGIAPLQENDKDDKIQTAEGQDEDETQMDDAGNDVVVNLDAALTDLCDAPVAVDSTHKDVFQDSPVKQKDLESVMASEVGQSPSSGRTRGTWSPSASPSTSILKKGQKRPLEEETPSPLVKSRRVSFADPIQQQETADDIDRRSPAIRTSSPRRSKVSSIPQPKYVTTPTKGLMILSPRNLRSPGYKSSKKCLISEMSQEPRPVPRDCIYPALVGCSTPVEAVLPQISSNMWSRGFGQLVRARNIKTVGDLSALTPTEIKTLPIRSPKVSNVKKALKIYEQQRKGKGGDELKSLDEMEMMTSELEETSVRQNQDEEDKSSAETLATELLDEPLPADVRPQQDGGENQTPDAPTGGDQQHQTEVLLLSDVEALSSRMTPPELSRCSPQELLQMHDQLGGLMRRVVVELHTRLRHTDGKP
ncbi:telomere-associated protein RIF1 [Echeneis naucrates]|uniref:telomere-associated protein RIF1 n=1 Tax=Echeneis naucrates TaxID=173247 RepID=UPI0011146BB2|nr:telomere-associated protein RIF1 [Echeneis naucrates]